VRTAQESDDILKENIDTATSGQMQNAMDKSSEVRRVKGLLDPTLKSNQATYNAFRGLDSQGRAELADNLLNLDKQYGMGLKEDVSKLQMYNTFANPANLPQSFQGITSTSRTGAAAALGAGAGSALGRGLGKTSSWSLMGGLAGAAAATAAFNAKNLRRAAALKYYGGQAMEAIPGASYYQAIPPQLKYQLMKETGLEQNATPEKYDYYNTNPWGGM
jgi:hypothetical protein